MTTDVLVVMGSRTDWPTMKHACDVLEELEVFYQVLVVSAHRTPDRLAKIASETVSKLSHKVVIAGAGGAAHLPGMFAAFAPTVPVLGVPVKSSSMSGLDSLYSIVQMPGGVPVGTLAIGEAGAKNAGILAAQILAVSDEKLWDRVLEYRKKQTDSVPYKPEGNV